MISSMVSIPTILAADCFGGQGQSKYVQYAWKAREQMCGSGCARSDGSNYCSLSIQADDGATIELQRSDPSGQYKYWQVLFSASVRVVLMYAVMTRLRIS